MDTNNITNLLQNAKRRFYAYSGLYKAHGRYDDAHMALLEARNVAYWRSSLREVVRTHHVETRLPDGTPITFDVPVYK